MSDREKTLPRWARGEVPPEHGTTRFRVSQTSAWGEPYLERIAWEEGKRWEDSSDDEAAVLREYLTRVRAYEAQQQANLARVGAKIRDACQRLDQLEATGG